MRFFSKITVPRHLIVGVALLLCSVTLGAAEYQRIPPLQGRVTDLANVLPAADRERLADTLARYERETFHQIAVLTIPTLSGESIESFSLRAANSWRLGQKGIDNGILITLAIKEKKARIELGFGMEKFIMNATARSIINTSMAPAFRKGNYVVGLQNGLEQLMKEARSFVVTPADLQRAKER